MILPPLAKIAAVLGGEVNGEEVLAPGPGHSTDDRSLCVKPVKDGPEGFVVHSFAGDNPKACRHDVREKLALPKRAEGRKEEPQGQRSEQTMEPDRCAICISAGGRNAVSAGVSDGRQGIFPKPLERPDVGLQQTVGAEDPLQAARTERGTAHDVGAYH